MTLSKEDIKTIKTHIANVFPKLVSFESKGFGYDYPFNMSHTIWELDLPELNDAWELIRIYEDNITVKNFNVLVHGRMFHYIKIKKINKLF